MSIFSNVAPARVKKTAFDLTHERKLSMNLGELTPILVQEVLPGDKWSINSQHLIRFAPLVSPVMHRMNAYIHYFYVPSRIIWPDFPKFISGEEDITVPLQKIPSTVSLGSLADHMGIPVGSWSNIDALEDINILPFMAYFKVWNEFYRDQNLQAEVDLTDSQFLSTILESPLLKRAWEKDYFTSAWPWLQKGIASSALVDIEYSNPAKAGTIPSTGHQPLTVENLTGNLKNGTTWSDTSIENITEASLDMQELRRAEKLQRWLERNARAGTRYIEHLLGHWGVKSSDRSLQRPEYIGGGKSPVVISEVLNTAAAADPETQGLPVGNMAGHGISVGRTNQASKYCEEHGYILGIMSVMPESAYYQGLPRFLSRKVNLDFAFPEFAQLGEQEVLNKEIYLKDTATGAENNQVFGYQSRYADYKYIPSSVHGDFRDKLEFWHMALKFSDIPDLNSDFIECDTANDDLNRIFAVENSEEKLYVQVVNQITALRPLPYYNNPNL